MPDLLESVHVISYLGLAVLLVLWIVLFRGAHILVMLLRREPLLGWAIGPFGITVMFAHEPSVFFIWLAVLFPALVSSGVLYIGFFTALSPVELPHHPLVQLLVISSGVLISSIGDLLRALNDLRHPLWGEARVLRSIQFLRATWARIHFTPFGLSYLSDHFGSTPNELLQAL